MKKLTGWLLIIFCSIFLLIFVPVPIAFIPDVLTGNSEGHMDHKVALNSLIGLVIVISLSIWGLRNGLKKIKNEKVIEIVEYNKVLNINVTGKINYTDYRNMIFRLSYKKPVFLVALAVMLLFSLTFLENEKSIVTQLSSNYFIFIFMGIFLLSPFLTLVQIKKIYDTNKMFQEQLNYILTNDSIHIKGNTVESIQKWAHFNQIKMTKNFILLYQGKTTATFLDKKMFSENELDEFLDFIKSLNVKRS